MSISNPNEPTLDPSFDPFAGPVIVATAPSTEPQREIWTAALLGSDASLAYNESISLRMHGPVDVTALRDSLSDLVHRHESLRCTFSSDGTTLCFLAEMPAEIVLEDLTALTSDERENRLKSHFAGIVEDPFDLERGPLFRAHLFVLGQDDHLLTFTAHHIVFDGFSTAILIDDWGQVYSSRKQGAQPQLPPAEAFSEYARQVKRNADADVYSAHERYWIDQFRGDIPVLDLPYDRPRPPVKTYASRRLDFTLDGDLLRDTKKLGAKQGASLFVTLLTSFGVLLSRLSGQEDIVVGIPAAGQSVGGHDALVGHCVNMLPIRGDYGPNQTLSSLLGVMRKRILDAYEHQEYTFGSLLKKLPIARDPSRLPLVSVVFNLDRGLTPDALKFEGLHVELRANARHFENFDLFVNAVDLRDKVIFECQYNTDLFDGDTMTKWFASYTKLLQSMVAGAASPIGELELLTVEEQQHLNRWNDTHATRTSAQCVHHLIEAQTDHTPDAIAVQCEGESISYRELEKRANQLAHRLRELGVQRDTLVGLCLERSIEMFIGLIAIHKAGGAYVPLDPGYPRDRLSYMVEDSGMRVLITDETLHKELALPIDRVVCIQEEATSLEAYADGRLAPDTSSASNDSLAYVIYTSGSTGKPKGVLIEHRSVVNLLASLHVTPGLSEKDVVLAITTLSFDIAVSEVILPLTVGARIVLVSRDVAADGSRLLQTIDAAGITFIDATPATYRLLLAAGWQGNSTLRIICTGEAMPKDLAVELVPRAKEVWNGYGPTETTVWSTFYAVTAPIGRILIGRPVDNTQIHILDKGGHPVPIGVTGEMFIGGQGLARGYLNRPELTAERFVPDTLAPNAGARMYKTGDLGRYLADGNIECLGRNDNQVKLRGFRIELGEIENALATHPAIESAAVIVREDRPGDRRLCAYFVARNQVVESDLRSHLKSTLPDYMIPQHFVALDRMPLTPSGKIDRKSLPVPSADSRSSEGFVEPITASEKLVAELWKQALVVSRVSSNDDFFALGGHSLLASQILARLRVEHGVVIPFRKMFEAPTISAFAKLVDECVGQGAPAPVQIIPHIENQEVARLSFSQERIWNLDEMDPNAWRSHLLPAAWRLEGPLDVGCLKQAMQALANRHGLLRASFCLAGDEPAQRTASSVECDLQEHDLTDFPVDQHERELDRIFEADVEMPYDLSKAPLMRSVLIRLSESEHVLYSSRHNIIWDGWSFDLYLRDLTDAYIAIRNGRTPELPPLPISYADFSAWHREWLDGPESAKQLEYWSKQLAGDLAPLALPSDRTPGSARTHEGANAWVHLSTAEADRLTEIAHAHGSTLYTVLLSAFATLLHRYTTQSEFLIGTPVRARTRPETENIIGPFVNTLALRFQIDPNMSFLDLVSKVRDTTLDAFTYQECPLEALGAKAPSVRVNFSLQDARTRPTSFGDLTITQQHVMHRSAVNDLTMWAMHSTKDLLVVVNYSTELFAASTIEWLLDAYKALVAEVLRNPSIQLGRLSLISNEAGAFAKQASGGARARVNVSTIGQHLAANAAADESRTAISQDNRSVTYGSLCRAVDNAMQVLGARGVTPSSRVLVLSLAGPSALIAILATLELGARCVPVTTQLPSVLVASALGMDSSSILVADSVAQRQFSGLFADLSPSRVLSLEAMNASDESATSLSSLRSLEQGDTAVEILCVAEDGTPRLVPSTFGELIAAIDPLVEDLKGASPASVLALDAFGTIAWILEAVLAITTGATLVLPSSASHRMLSPDVDWLQSVKPTVIAGPADALHAICADTGWQAPLERLISVGLPARGSVLQSLIERAGGVFNVFSFVEGGVWSCGGRVQGSTDRYWLGRALGSCQIEVRDDEGRHCPIGVSGRVHVVRTDGTSLVMKDRARLLGDGVFEYRDPGTRIAWLWGNRVELRAVEDALAGHPAIREAAVVVLERHQRESALVAYVSLNANVAYTETELRTHLRQTLPASWVPHDFVELPSLPRLAGGQVATASLPSPFAEFDRTYEAPRTEAQQLLAEIWRSVLKQERISIDDNFFSIGGHSLLCFQVIDDVQRRTGIRISPRSMLLDTLEQVAVGLEQPRGPTPPQTPNQMQASFGGKLFGKLKKIVGT
jgi:amino acid adenylation domain-containing protein